METEWTEDVPKKVAIMIWRVKLGRIPTREVLDKMGINMNSVICPRCSRETESINHALFRCEEVIKMWQRVARWWNVDVEHIDSVGELRTMSSDAVENVRTPKLWKEMLWHFLYLVWSHRNRLVFKKEQRTL